MPSKKDGSDSTARREEAWRTTTVFTDVPNVPGIYALYDDDGLLYVGSSEEMRKRLLQHRSAGRISFTLAKYRICRRLGDWLRVEYALIKRLDPPCNHRSSRIVHRVLPKNRFLGLKKRIRFAREHEKIGGASKLRDLKEERLARKLAGL